MSILIADTHVHFYPCYDPKVALDTLRSNLADIDDRAVCGAFLAERHDCHFFREFQQRILPHLSPKVQAQCQEDFILLREKGWPDLYIFPGRQVITRERVEILSLTSDTLIPDGLPAQDVLSEISSAGGLPVISWAPGKWFFGRKKVVKDLLDSNRPGTLLVGDTTLRPVGWLQPVLMRYANNKGFAIVAGSDPLPFTGEEKNMGQYAIRLEKGFDLENPVESIRSLLTQPGLKPILIGKREGVFTTLQRLIKNARSKKQSG
jgi:hypothetical protein